MKRKFVYSIVPALMVALGSPVVWAEDAAVDCSTAKADIAHLQHEKKSTDERKMKGVLAIMPLGIVVNAASSAEHKDSNKEMHIDEYNKKIDERIAEIKSSCADSLK